MTGDPQIDRVLERMANATTADEALDCMWNAHSLGATWQECREAYDRYEQRQARP